MTDSEKIEEIIMICSDEARDLDFDFDENSARYVLEWFSDWKNSDVAKNQQVVR